MLKTKLTLNQRLYRLRCIVLDNITKKHYKTLLSSELIKKVKNENIFYHTCPNNDLESILKQGLLRRKSSLWSASGGAIYLGNEPKWMCKNKNYTILKIILPKEFILNCEIWHIDDYFNKKSKEWQFVCWRDIPKEYISIYKKSDK